MISREFCQCVCTEPKKHHVSIQSEVQNHTMIPARSFESNVYKIFINIACMYIVLVDKFQAWRLHNTICHTLSLEEKEALEVHLTDREWRLTGI